MTVCRCFYVSGEVQGVFFRATTRDKAIDLGLTGYAQNLADGRVDVMICGNADKVTQMQQWLWQGPAMASVTAVDEYDCSDNTHSGFQIG